MVFIIITIFLIIKILIIIILLDRWYLKQIGFPKKVIFKKTLKNMYSIGITYVIFVVWSIVRVRLL